MGKSVSISTHFGYFGVFLTRKLPLEEQPEFPRKIPSVTFFAYTMFRVSAKFKKNSKCGFWEKCHFGYFWVFLTLKHPLQNFPEKSALSLFLPISCSKSEQNFFQIQSVVIEKSAILAILGCYWPWNAPWWVNQSFPEKSVRLLFLLISCSKFVQNFLKIQGVVFEKSAILAILGCFWPWNTPSRVFPKNLPSYFFHPYHFWSLCKISKKIQGVVIE